MPLSHDVGGGGEPIKENLFEFGSDVEFER